MPRFVVLHHVLPPDSARPTHWDLLLERGEALASWALAVAPRAGAEIRAEALADHRLAYLDYEGPVSGNRGTVSRWDEGTYEPLAISPERLEVELAGRRLIGRAVLTKDAEGWRFRLA